MHTPPPASLPDPLFPERLAPVLTVTDEDVSLATFAAKHWVDPPTAASLDRASLVFVPWERFRGLDEPIFPQTTGELFGYLRTHAPAGVHVEIAAGDAAYSEVALHADVVFLPTLLVTGATTVLLPVAINLVSEWLKQRLLERHKSADVKFDMLVIDEGVGSRRIHYEGPAEQFAAVLTASTAGGRAPASLPEAARSLVPGRAASPDLGPDDLPPRLSSPAPRPEDSTE